MSEIKELLDVAAGWDRASATTLARANRLGNCRAGEVAAAEAGIYRQCADELRASIAAMFPAIVAATGREARDAAT